MAQAKNAKVPAPKSKLAKTARKAAKSSRGSPCGFPLSHHRAYFIVLGGFQQFVTQRDEQQG